MLLLMLLAMPLHGYVHVITLNKKFLEQDGSYSLRLIARSKKGDRKYTIKIVNKTLEVNEIKEKEDAHPNETISAAGEVITISHGEFVVDKLKFSATSGVFKGQSGIGLANKASKLLQKDQTWSIDIDQAQTVEPSKRFVITCTTPK